MRPRPSSMRECVITNYQIIDSPRLTLRRGDIILLPDSYWVPKYAKKQFAVVLERYQQTKTSGSIIFYNYKAKVMMLTGPRKGHVRTYGSPFGPSLNYHKFLMEH